MRKLRQYMCTFHCGEQPIGTVMYVSFHRKGSKANRDDAYRAIKRKFGVRVRQSAEIDSIVRYEYEGYM